MNATLTPAAPAASTRTKHLVAPVAELPPGARKIVKAGRFEVGVFNLKGEYKAALNICPHALAPVCAGPVRGTMLPAEKVEYNWGMDGEVLSCPWHGWEFSLKDGRSLHDPKRCGLKMFEVVVEDGNVYVLA
ncbi:MAG: Rieske (2Fe-2S) protein [Planctomycetota bacterium]|nr:Rieske (2Fe-2S) protein [Planctomycetota bacterium]